MNENEIKRLIPGCLKKERTSQQALYKNCYTHAMGICLRYTSERAVALEILNSGFLKVFMNLEKYNEQIPFKAWIGRIMINNAIDHYRSGLKFAHLQPLTEEHDVAELPAIESKINYHDLLKLIQYLPDAYRTVFNLFVIDGYNHPEIANMLRISVGTSKSNLFKARKKLQELIAMANQGNLQLIEKQDDATDANNKMYMRNGL